MKTVILKPTLRNIARCADEIKRGGLVAFPTETVYGLGASAFDADAVRSVYAAKGRPQDNPLIVHVEKSADISLAALPTKAAEKLAAAFMPGALTLVLPKRDIVPPEVTCGLSTVAVRVPAHETARALIAAAGVPIAAPSANTSGRPSPTEARHVYDDLSGKIPYILDGGRCTVGIESTVVDVTGETPVILRPGYVTAADIARVCGACGLARHSSGDAAAALPAASPGTKYAHYAPRCFAALVTDGFAQKAAAYRDNNPGKRIALICYEGAANGVQGVAVLTVGSTPEHMAAGLYAALREAERNADAILIQHPGTDALAQSLLNRIEKAVSGNIL